MEENQIQAIWEKPTRLIEYVYCGEDLRKQGTLPLVIRGGMKGMCTNAVTEMADKHEIKDNIPLINAILLCHLDLDAIFIEMSRPHFRESHTVGSLKEQERQLCDQGASNEIAAAEKRFRCHAIYKVLPALEKTLVAVAEVRDALVDEYCGLTTMLAWNGSASPVFDGTRVFIAHFPK